MGWTRQTIRATNSNKHVEAAVPREPLGGVRVADSSIFPHVTYANLNGPSIMTGEKAADHVLGRHPLARSNQEPRVNPRGRQRPLKRRELLGSTATDRSSLVVGNVYRQSDRNTDAGIRNRSLSARACRTLICRFPLKISDTTD